MSSLRPWETCHRGPFFSKNAAMFSVPGTEPSGQNPVAEPSASAAYTFGGSASDWREAAASTLAHADRTTPSGARLSLRSNQVISGASASRTGLPFVRSSSKAARNWYPPP